jgi:hypothetical protein
MTYSIKSKPNSRNWSASGQVRWRNTPKKKSTAKKGLFPVQDLAIKTKKKTI